MSVSSLSAYKLFHPFLYGEEILQVNWFSDKWVRETRKKSSLRFMFTKFMHLEDSPVESEAHDHHMRRRVIKPPFGSFGSLGSWPGIGGSAQTEANTCTDLVDHREIIGWWSFAAGHLKQWTRRQLHDWNLSLNSATVENPRTRQEASGSNSSPELIPLRPLHNRTLSARKWESIPGVMKFR